MDKTNIRELFHKKTSIRQLVRHFDLGINPVVGTPHFAGTCPLHEERSPYRPFYIYHQEDRFHCATCGISGDSYDFVVDVAGLTSDEAKKFLSTEFGVPLSEIITEEQLISAVIAELNRSIMCQIKEALTLLALPRDLHNPFGSEPYEDTIMKVLGVGPHPSRYRYKRVEEGISKHSWEPSEGSEEDGSGGGET
jgi:hypothetical protein